MQEAECCWSWQSAASVVQFSRKPRAADISSQTAVTEWRAERSWPGHCTASMHVLCTLLTSNAPVIAVTLSTSLGGLR